jgi:nicotinate-nucleotide adenylyltransferase
LKIAIFGGSFDPVHIAHKAIIETSLKQLDIDKLIIIPTYLNPFKKDFLFEPITRYNLLKKVFKDNPKIEVSDFEINQKKLSYTYETIRYIKKLYNPSKLFFIIGEDNLKSLHRWHNTDELKENLEFVVAKRSGYSLLNNDFKTLDINIDISSTILREKLNLDYIPKEIWEDLEKLNKGDTLNKRLEDIKFILEDKKAADVEVFDLQNKEYLVDYVVIATTLNPKHGSALLDYLKTDLKPKGEEFLRVDEDENWTVIDLGDIFIHLMNEKYRSKYNIEEFLEEFKKAKS